MHPMCKHFGQRERREWVGGLALCPKESEWGGGEEVRRTPFSSAEKEELLACAFCKRGAAQKKHETNEKKEEEERPRSKGGKWVTETWAKERQEWGKIKCIYK